MTKLERSLIDTLIQTGYGNDTLFDGTPFPELEPLDEKETATSSADAELLCSLETTITNVTSDLHVRGFPLLAGRIDAQLGDLQDAIRDAGLELGQHC